MTGEKRLFSRISLFAAVLLSVCLTTFSCGDLFTDIIATYNISSASADEGAMSTASGGIVNFTGTISDVLSNGAVPTQYAALSTGALSANQSSGTQTANQSSGAQNSVTSGSRSALPELPTEDISYIVAAETIEKAADGTTPLKTATGSVTTVAGSAPVVTVPLLVGYKWRITVTMKYDDEAILSDSYTMEEVLSASNPFLTHDFVLSSLTTGNGTVSLGISDPDGAFSSVSVSSVRKNGVDKRSEWNDAVQVDYDGIYTISGMSLPGGAYDVTLKFAYNGVLVYSTTQTIFIFPNMLTDKWVTSLADEDGALCVTQDMADAYTITDFFVGTNSAGGTASDENTGSPYNPLATLEAALDRIQLAGDSSKDYTIHVSGEQTGNFLLGAGLNGRANSITLCGMTGSSTDIFNGDGEGTVLTVSTVVPVTIQKIAITGGNANGSGEKANGGGIYCSTGSNVTLTNGSIVSGNTASGEGGGAYLCAGATLSQTDSVSGNTKSDGSISNVYNSETACISSGEALAALTAGESYDFVASPDMTNADMSEFMMSLFTVGAGSSNLHFDTSTLDLSQAVNVTELQLPWLYGNGTNAQLDNHITSLVLPPNLTDVNKGGYTLYSTLSQNITEITIADSNSKYCTQDGILYSKDMKELVWYPAKKPGDSFTTPSSVTKIGKQAFYGNQTLKNLVIASNVKTIGESVFLYSHLEEVTINGSVTSLGSELFQSSSQLRKAVLPASLKTLSYRVFYGCTALKEIIFNGTSKQWSTIAINDSYGVWNEGVPGSVRCTDGFVFVSGKTVSNAVSGSSVFITGRSVAINNLFVCDHEVTQAEFQTIMGTNPSYFDGSTGKEPADGETQENRPVENVSWYAAIAYCNKRSAAENLTPCYSVSGITDWQNFAYSSIPTEDDETWNAVTCSWTANGYRLPTEAEWEYLARGGNNGIPSTQYDYAGSNTIGDVAWYSGNTSDMTHEVKKKDANILSIYDMSGNVYEWCWDFAGDISDETAATGADSGTLRVTRGGAKQNTADFCEVSYRDNLSPFNSGDYLGFRVVRKAQ